MLARKVDQLCLERLPYGGRLALRKFTTPWPKHEALFIEMSLSFAVTVEFYSVAAVGLHTGDGLPIV